MGVDSLDFAWKVPTSGYRWVREAGTTEPATEPRPLLAEAAPSDAGQEAALAPPSHPALFLEFADTEPDENGVLAFANRYGSLEVGVKRLATAPGRNRPAAVPGECIDLWRVLISAMRRLTTLWDLTRRADQEVLARHITWDGAAVYFDSHPDGDGGATLGLYRVKEEIASESTDAEWLKEVKQGDVLQPARRYLQVELDLHLHHSADDVRIGMCSDPRTPHPVLSYRCPTLRSALWVQFAAAVAADRTFGRCRECRRWFEVGPAVARAHRRYCSNGCRSKAYRERQGRARRLHSQKMSIPKIAEVLDADVGAVRRWITGAKPQQ